MIRHKSQSSRLRQVPGVLQQDQDQEQEQDEDPQSRHLVMRGTRASGNDAAEDRGLNTAGMGQLAKQWRDRECRTWDMGNGTEDAGRLVTPSRGAVIA
ncbi:hypothetical protein ACLKA6_014062 [Drosophila palustris]